MSDGSIRFADMTRGSFLALPVVPQAGYQWVERITLGFSTTEQTDGPWLVQNEGNLGVHEPVLKSQREGEELFRRFAGLRTPAAMLRFAEKYGLLGRDSERVWDPNTGQVTDRLAEALISWQGAITEMAALLKVWDLFNEEDEDTLSQFVYWHEEPRILTFTCGYSAGRLVPIHGRLRPAMLQAVFDSLLIDERTGRGHKIFDLWPTNDILGPTYGFLASEVNSMLRGHVHPTVLHDRNGLYFQPDSLWASLCSLFALEVAGRDNLHKLCARPGCGRRFVVRDARLIYCSANCRKRNYDQLKRSPTPLIT